MTGLLYYRVHRFRKFIVMVHLLKRALFTAHSTKAGISRVCDFTKTRVASVIDMEIVKLISDSSCIFFLKNGHVFKLNVLC